MHLHLHTQLTMEVPSNLEVPSLDSKLPFQTIILVTIIVLLGAYFKLKVSLHRGKNLPPGSLGFPFVGETLSFLKAQKQDKTVQWIADRITKYGPVFKTSLISSKAIVITGQAGNKLVFSGGDNGFVSNLPQSLSSILGKHSIFEVTGSRHKLIRGAMMTFLKPESLQRIVGEMDSLVKQQLFQELNGKDSTHGVRLMKRITFKVTCSLLFGLPEGKEKDALFADFILAAKGTLAIPLDLPGTAFGNAIQARRRISKLFSQLISRKRREMEEGKVRPDDNMVSTFVALKDENGELLPEEEIIDNFVILMMASHDTTTIVLSMFLRLLARDAEVRGKVLEEQRQALKAREENGGKLGWSDVQKMKYTWRVSQELMRMTPPVFGNFKRTSRDISFGGFHIPKGWQIMWVTSPTHMDEKIFSEPEKFNPSRFENPRSIPPYAYIPFGAGHRICPGADFARSEVLLLIHHLVTNYEWAEMIPNEPIIREPLPYPAMGLPLKLKPKKICA
ncbi:taxane 13-alpha-hydroxylase-like [Camellia sinensis]|nr:taxane 13-alpha-hydroxylase-like [Camellia sinensis]